MVEIQLVGVLIGLVIGAALGMIVYLLDRWEP